MNVFEVILIMVELLLCVAVILIMLLLFMMLHEILRPRQQKPVKPNGEGEQGSGSM